MKNNSFLLFTAIIVILHSCSKTAENNDGSMSSDTIVTINSDCFMHDSNLCTSSGDFGKYTDFFCQPDATIGISSSRSNPLDEETIMAFYDPVELALTKSSTVDNHVEDIKINGNTIFSPNTKSNNESIADMFGNTISFNLSGFGPSTKSLDWIELYAPQIVRIQFPTICSEIIQHPLCYYQNFIVRWNQDSSNNNGVVILIKWNGTMIFGEDYQNSYVIHSICVPDTGFTELEESMFEGIPDAAYCNLYLFRGDVENIEIDEAKYRLLAESHDELDFILVRNIE